MSAQPVPAPSPSARAQFDIAFEAHAADTATITPRTTTRRAVISPHARLIAIITSPADHAGVWGIAEGTIGGAITYHIAPDAQNITDTLKQWDSLGRSWAVWVKHVAADDEAAQLIVANHAAIDKLNYAAKRIITHPKASDYARQAAAHIITSVHYTRAPGAQTILPLVSVLREHYTTGADTAYQMHLGHWVNYPNQPAGWDAEQTGIDPDFEAQGTRFGDTADKMLTATGTRRIPKAARIPSLLKPVLTKRYENLRAGLALYQAHPGEELPAARALYEKQAKAVARFYDKGTRPSMRSIPARVATLSERESTGELWQASLWAYDAIERARGIISGDVLVGEACGDTLSLAPGRVVRARASDVFTVVGESKSHTVIELAVGADGGTRVVFDRPLPEQSSVVMYPALPVVIPPRWVTPNWVHDTGNTPDTVPVETSITGGQSLSTYAEALKGA